MLTSTSTTNALSAAQGKVLNDALAGKAATSHTHLYAGSATAGGSATSADKVVNKLTIQQNGVTSGTFDGSAAATVNITPASIGAATVAQLGNYLPLTGGTVTGNITAVGFYQSSDERLKTNIKVADLDRYKDLNKLELKEYQWISTGKPDVGYLAQEVEALYPELVKTDENGYKSVDYIKIMLIKLHMLGK